MGDFFFRQPDELYHYGVKGMKWGVRHDPERGGNSRQRKGMSIAKKVAIGVAAVAAVAGVTYVGVKAHQTSKYNKAARAAVQRAMNQYGKRTVANGGNLRNGPSRTMNISRGPKRTVFSPGPNNLVTSSEQRMKITGHSGRVTKAGAAKHRYQFYNRKAADAPYTFDYLSNRTGHSKGAFEERADKAGKDVLDIYKRRKVVTFDNHSSINKLTRKKRRFR